MVNKLFISNYLIVKYVGHICIEKLVVIVFCDSRASGITLGINTVFTLVFKQLKFLYAK